MNPFSYSTNHNHMNEQHNQLQKKFDFHLQNNEHTVCAMEFRNTGYLISKLNKDDLAPIHDEVNKIKLNFESSDRANKDLAGNIQYEFNMVDTIDHVSNLVLPLIEMYDSNWNYLSCNNPLTKSVPLILDRLWVNFQKKHEFNPTHVHTSVMSFVIWLDIPYNIDDEMSVLQSRDSVYNVPGHFEFVYTDSLGRISQHRIPVDKKYNGTIVVFPSVMPHTVYPFTTSDKYRISVAGNFKYQV